MKHNIIFRIAFCAIMAAMAIVLERFSFRIGNWYKITFYALPLILIGLMSNTKYSLLTGIVSGFIMQMGFGFTVTTPFWMLAPVVWCVVPSLVWKLNLERRSIKILLAVVIASLSATFVNTLAMYADYFFIADAYYTNALILAKLPIRLAQMAVTMIPYYLISVMVYEALDKIIITKIAKQY